MRSTRSSEALADVRLQAVAARASVNLVLASSLVALGIAFFVLLNDASAQRTAMQTSLLAQAHAQALHADALINACIRDLAAAEDDLDSSAAEAGCTQARAAIELTRARTALADNSAPDDYDHWGFGILLVALGALFVNVSMTDRKIRQTARELAKARVRRIYAEHRAKVSRVRPRAPAVSTTRITRDSRQR